MCKSFESTQTQSRTCRIHPLALSFVAPKGVLLVIAFDRWPIPSLWMVFQRSFWRLQVPSYWEIYAKKRICLTFRPLTHITINLKSENKNWKFSKNSGEFHLTLNFEPLGPIRAWITYRGVALPVSVVRVGKYAVDGYGLLALSTYLHCMCTLYVYCLVLGAVCIRCHTFKPACLLPPFTHTTKKNTTNTYMIFIPNEFIPYEYCSVCVAHYTGYVYR